MERYLVKCEIIQNRNGSIVRSLKTIIDTNSYDFARKMAKQLCRNFISAAHTAVTAIDGTLIDEYKRSDTKEEVL